MNKYFSIFLVLICAFIISCNTGGAQTSAPASGASADQEKSGSSPAAAATAAPDFKFTDLDGKEHSISSFKGKVLVLDFWATWCPPCRQEFPHFVELYNTYKDQGLVIVGCSLDKTVAPVKEFAAKNNVTFILTMGNVTQTDLYGGVTGIPTTFIINKEGNIVEKIVGGRDKDYFEKIIKPLL